MGLIRKISCPTCGKSWEIKTGCGLQHSRLEVIADLYKTDMAQTIKQIAADNPFPRFHFEYRVAHCVQCQSIVSVPVLEVKPDGELFIGVCPECEGESVLIHDVQTSTCPMCHSKGLKCKETGHWD